MSKTFVVYMTALVNALKMTYVNLGSVKRGVCKPNDRLRISLLFMRMSSIRFKPLQQLIPNPLQQDCGVLLQEMHMRVLLVLCMHASAPRFRAAWSCHQLVTCQRHHHHSPTVPPPLHRCR